MRPRERITTASAILALALTACMKNSYSTGLPGGGAVHTEKARFFLWGLVGEQDCGGSVELEHTPKRMRERSKATGWLAEAAEVSQGPPGGSGIALAIQQAVSGKVAPVLVDEAVQQDPTTRRAQGRQGRGHDPMSQGLVVGEGEGLAGSGGAPPAVPPVDSGRGWPRRGCGRCIGPE